MTPATITPSIRLSPQLWAEFGRVAADKGTTRGSMIVNMVREVVVRERRKRLQWAVKDGVLVGDDGLPLLAPDDPVTKEYVDRMVRVTVTGGGFGGGLGAGSVVIKDPQAQVTRTYYPGGEVVVEEWE